MTRAKGIVHRLPTDIRWDKAVEEGDMDTMCAMVYGDGRVNRYADLRAMVADRLKVSPFKSERLYLIKLLLYIEYRCRRETGSDCVCW